MKEAKRICYKCSCDLSDRPDILTLITNAQKKIRIVRPTCLSDDCGQLKNEHPKRPNKRPAPGARPAPKPKRQRGDEGDAAPTVELN